MPEYRMRQVNRVRVKASPAEAWKVVRALDIESSLISQILFKLRSLPEVFAGKTNNRNENHQTFGIESFTGPGKGFQILDELPGEEIVVGSVGKFWKLNIEWVQINSETFRTFNNPGYGKLAWNLRVDSDGHGGSWITWDLRVNATDAGTWQFFQKYWLVIGRFSHWLRRSALKQFCKKLGGRVSEEGLKLSGDDLVPSPKYQKTLSTTIEVPPEKVWPWLMQMGCQRGGWYSIDRLDNGGIPSAKKILPEFQHIQVGETLPWKPEGEEGFTVLSLTENKALVLGTATLLKGPHVVETPFDDTWSFSLEPIGSEATRLITRVRADYQSTLAIFLLNLWLKPAHLIMEQAQLRNLKKRIELHASL